MNQRNRWIALLLALALALSLAACGGGENTDVPGKPQATPTPEYVYASDYSEVDMGDRNYFNVFYSNDRGFYGTINEVVGQRELEEGETLEWEGQLDIYERRMYLLGYDGRLQRIEGYAAPEYQPEEGHEGNCYEQSMCAMPDGGFVQIVDQYEYWSDAPEDVEPYTDEWYNYYRNKENYYIRRLDSDGSELSFVEMDIERLLEEAGNDYFYPNNVAVSEDGCVLVSGSGGIYAFDMETGEYAFRVEGTDNWVDRLIRLADGRLGASYYGDRGQEFAIVDTASHSLKDPISVSGDLYNAVGGSGDYLLYYTNGTNFCGVRAEDGEVDKLFNWINCDVDPSSLNSFSVQDDGTVIGIMNEWDENYEHNTTSIVTVGLKLASELPQKQTLTLATRYVGWDQRRQIINFNRHNDSVRIEVLDYSEYDSADDYDENGKGEAGSLVKLRTELMAGNMPDILDLSGLPAKQLAAKGLLADLYELLDADPELSREDFFPNVLAALENDGKLYSTVDSFYILTVTGASSKVGDTPGWTCDELLAALDTMPEDCTIFNQYATRDEVLRYCLSLEMDRFVDWNTGKVNFETGAFTDMLEFAALFPATFDYNNYEWDPNDNEYKRIMSGRQMLMTTYLSNFDDVNYYQYIFGGDVDGYTFIGFPCSEGVGSMLSVQTGYAISAGCADKEAAWQFLRQFMTQKYQEKNGYDFPSNLHAYETMKTRAMTPEYQKDMDGNYVLDEDGNKIELSHGGMGWGEGDFVEFYALKPEQVARVEELIKNTTRVFDYDNEILDIVNEQSAAFFAGQKSAEEVARLVQSKANIYVNEHR